MAPLFDSAFSYLFSSTSFDNDEDSHYNDDNVEDYHYHKRPSKSQSPTSERRSSSPITPSSSYYSSSKSSSDLVSIRGTTSLSTLFRMRNHNHSNSQAAKSPPPMPLTKQQQMRIIVNNDKMFHEIQEKLRKSRAMTHVAAKEILMNKGIIETTYEEENAKRKKALVRDKRIEGSKSLRINIYNTDKLSYRYSSIRKEILPGSLSSCSRRNKDRLQSLSFNRKNKSMSQLSSTPSASYNSRNLQYILQKTVVSGQLNRTVYTKQ